MWELIVFLLSLTQPAALQPDDYVGPVAVEFAYAAAQPTAAPVKPKVPTSECKNCNGTGRVRTGDGQGWTKCPECEPDLKIDPTSNTVPVLAQ